MESFEPTVSVVIPVYNGSNYLKEAIDSVLAQTYRNIEIVVVNDGSTDDGATDSIARSYGDKIRYFSKGNGGVATALNLAIEKATGQYISWLSHDDLYRPNKIKKQVQLLAKLPVAQRDLSIPYCTWTSINARGDELGNADFIAAGHTAAQLNHQKYALVNGLIHGCALLIPKKAFEEIGYFDPKLRTTQDYDLWVKFFSHYSPVFLNEPLICSRTHENQGSRTIQSHGPEQELLWKKILTWLTSEEISSGWRSRDDFYEFFLRHIKSNVRLPSLVSFVVDRYQHFSEVKVSVIIPFFNRLDLTVRAIESVLKQTHQNFEILLIDDGSTDSQESLDPFAMDTRVVIRRIENSGAAAARNVGIRIASGDFIAFLDSDDEFHVDKLRTQIRFMTEGTHQFTFTSYMTWNSETGILDLQPVGRLKLSYPSIFTGCPIATPTVMLSRDLAKKESFPTDCKYGEDVIFWSRLAKIVDPVGLNLALTTVHINSSSAAYNPTKFEEGMANILIALRTSAPIFWFTYKVVTKVRFVLARITSAADRQRIKRFLERNNLGVIVDFYRYLKSSFRASI